MLRRSSALWPLPPSLLILTSKPLLILTSPPPTHAAIDGRLLPLSLPHAPLHAGPEVAHFSNVNSSAQGEGTATVLIRNAQRFEVAVQVYDAEGRPHTHATLRAGERVSATLPRGAWIR